jgi:hypothetical protein
MNLSMMEKSNLEEPLNRTISRPQYFVTDSEHLSRSESSFTLEKTRIGRGATFVDEGRELAFLNYAFSPKLISGAIRNCTILFWTGISLGIILIIYETFNYAQQGRFLGVDMHVWFIIHTLLSCAVLYAFKIYSVRLRGSKNILDYRRFYWLISGSLITLLLLLVIALHEVKTAPPNPVDKCPRPPQFMYIIIIAICSFLLVIFNQFFESPCRCNFRFHSLSPTLFVASLSSTLLFSY